MSVRTVFRRWSRRLTPLATRIRPKRRCFCLAVFQCLSLSQSPRPKSEASAVSVLASLEGIALRLIALAVLLQFATPVIVWSPRRSWTFQKLLIMLCAKLAFLTSRFEKSTTFVSCFQQQFFSRRRFEMAVLRQSFVRRNWQHLIL